MTGPARTKRLFAYLVLLSLAGASWLGGTAEFGRAQQQLELWGDGRVPFSLRGCDYSDARCAAEQLIIYLARTGQGRVQTGDLIRNMYRTCPSFDNAVCAARFIRRAIDQSQEQAAPEPRRPRVPPYTDPRRLPPAPTTRLVVSASACNGGQCRLDQATADHLCREQGYHYAVSFQAYDRKWNLRECRWDGGQWDCINNCPACGNGIHTVECAR